MTNTTTDIPLADTESRCRFADWLVKHREHFAGGAATVRMKWDILGVCDELSAALLEGVPFEVNTSPELKPFDCGEPKPRLIYDDKLVIVNVYAIRREGDSLIVELEPEFE